MDSGSYNPYDYMIIEFFNMKISEEYFYSYGNTNFTYIDTIIDFEETFNSLDPSESYDSRI